VYYIYGESMWNKVKCMLVSCFIISAGCSTGSEQSKDQQQHVIKKDALEPMNRFFMNFNAMIGHAFLDPITYGYEKIVPKPLQSRIADFLQNLMTPFTALCALFAGDGKEVVKSLGSFVVNTACGGGFFNVTHYKPKYRNLDDTFASYGMKQGEYIVLPVLGPSSVRDTIAKVIGCFVNPLYIFTKNIDNRDRVWIGHAVVTYLDTNRHVYKNLRSLRASAGQDYYTMLKAVYKQTTVQNNLKNLEEEENYAEEF